MATRNVRPGSVWSASLPGVRRGRPSSRWAPFPGPTLRVGPWTIGLKYESGTGIITAMLTMPSTHRRGDDRLGPALLLDQGTGSQPSQKCEDPEGGRRRAGPRRVPACEVRPGPSSRRPSVRRSRARTGLESAPSPQGRREPHDPGSIKKPAGVTSTVQTRVLYHGSDSLRPVDRAQELDRMTIVLPQVRLDSKN